MRSVSVILFTLFAGTVPAIVSPANALSQSRMAATEDLAQRARQRKDDRGFARPVDDDTPALECGRVFASG